VDVEQTTDRIISGDFDEFDVHAFTWKRAVNNNFLSVNLADSLPISGKRRNLERMTTVFYQSHREWGKDTGVLEYWSNGIME
jgi:hypothetical protein